jgi:hypothetical protein
MQLICRQCGEHFTPEHEGIVNLCPACDEQVAHDTAVLAAFKRNPRGNDFPFRDSDGYRELSGVHCGWCGDDWSYCPQHETEAAEIIARRHAR